MTKRKKTPKVAPKIECTFHSPDGDALPDSMKKSREFHILVQCVGKSGEILKQAVFTELSKARGYIQIREACDGLTAVPFMIEIDPVVVGQWTVRVETTKED